MPKLWISLLVLGAPLSARGDNLPDNALVFDEFVGVRSSAMGGVIVAGG